MPLSPPSRRGTAQGSAGCPKAWGEEQCTKHPAFLLWSRRFSKLMVPEAALKLELWIPGIGSVPVVS